MPLVESKEKNSSGIKSRTLSNVQMELMNLAPFGQTLKISDTDSCLNCLKRSTDYTTLYFINAAAFMKWKHCLNNGAIVQTI